MCGTVRRADRAGPGPAEKLEARTALLALAEEELHAHADAEDGAAGRDALADRIVEAVRREPAGGALDVADTGDHGERRLAHGSSVGRDRCLRSGAREGRGDGAQVAGPVVGEDDLHAIPFVDRIPPSPAATACRSAWPSALNAASAT